MDTKKLRQKILDLAIHGKLVPQDPNDEPASVLLERIKAEKERLIKEGKIKGSKKSAKTSDTPHYEQVPFEIPGNWVWCKIEDIGEVITGNTPSKDRVEYYGGDTPFFKPTDLDQGIDTRYASDHLSELGFEQSRKLPVNTILVTCIGATIGKTGIITVAGSCNQQINAIVPNKEVTHSYIFYVCVSNYMQSEIISNASATTLPILNKSNFANLLFPLPPIAEQHRIVKEIGHWFALIDQIEQDKSDLQIVIKQAKSKILDFAIHGKLVPQDPNDEPALNLLKRINPNFTPCDNGHSEKLPQGWYSATINDVCSIIGGVSYNKADIQDTGIRVLRGGNIQSGKVFYCSDDVFIPFSYQNKENQVQYGDIIVVASTGSQTLIGKTGFVDRDIPKTQIGAFLRIVRPKQKTLSPYIRLLFQTDAYKDYIRNVAKGSNINNVKNAHLQNYQICLPPLAEQQRIVTKIEELFSVLDNIQNALEA